VRYGECIKWGMGGFLRSWVSIFLVLAFYCFFTSHDLPTCGGSFSDFFLRDSREVMMRDDVMIPFVFHFFFVRWVEGLENESAWDGFFTVGKALSISSVYGI